MTHITICGPRNPIIVREEPLGERWCFVERKRRNFTLRVWRDDIEEDWYGPWASITCDSCGRVDADVGFGWSRE